jgi:hypothetical protein
MIIRRCVKGRLKLDGRVFFYGKAEIAQSYWLPARILVFAGHRLGWI